MFTAVNGLIRVLSKFLEIIYEENEQRNIQSFHGIEALK